MQIEALRTFARSLGFDLLGVSPPTPPDWALRTYREWLAQGFHGEMAYMARPDRVARREDPSRILPGVRAIVCVAVNYYPGPPPPTATDPDRGRISNYAWGRDYHDWMLPRLEELAAHLRAATGGTARYRTYVDTGPILERAFAAQAGLGFIGKNTCLIHPRLGSWLFLGEILVDVDLPFTGPPIPSRCGTCARCLEACPTGALVAPYVLDARRCISYLTVEFRGEIPPDLRARMGNWVYGCDVCQEVCPWNRFARLTHVPDFRPASADRVAPLREALATMDERTFQEWFGESPVARIGWERLKGLGKVCAG
ncbi:MAG: tRNA epoxyqueuosine(34) reductase QueG [Anaerolineae bacterium]|nr:tRNA epoxyqueuosine(34) reductase QueG [Anaerolineae bacterium]MCX8068129.1 tRNA epoxyqueuosine(34) reductase QueG [Anaerolineae bacterium]MDW7992289.1 tRNA epoxyqueuosine(34) reductase QueG [Anaerolineae bacterium]